MALKINIVHTEPVARIGHKCIVIREPSLIQKVLAVSQSDNEVAYPLQVEYCHILDQAEHKMQADLKQWRTSMKKINRASVFDGLRIHSTQEKHAISEL
jgi:hypothetical protein